MPAQILLTMDDLETAVPLNAALEAAGYATTMVSAMDDVRAVFRREGPDLLIVTGAVHESPAIALVALAREAEVSTLALLEPTDSERAERVARLGATAVMTKPARADELVATARRLVDRRQAAAAHRHQRRERRHPGSAGQDRADGAGVEHGAGAGRVGHRQGAGGQGDSRPVAAAGPAVHRGGLRRHSRHAARVRTLRPREGRLHRRGGAAARPLRAGRRRHDLPRRNRRHPAVHPGQAPAGAGEPRSSSGWAAPSRSRWTCAWWRPPIAISATRCSSANSATTCTTG